jgi:hypothetical protein
LKGKKEEMHLARGAKDKSNVEIRISSVAKSVDLSANLKRV